MSVSSRLRGVYTIEEISKIVGPIAREYGVLTVYVFGSYSRGEARRNSDIDFLIDPGELRGMRIGGFYTALGNALHKKVDVVTVDTDPRFVRMIQKDLVKVYGDRFRPHSPEAHG